MNGGVPIVAVLPLLLVFYYAPVSIAQSTATQYVQYTDYTIIYPFNGLELPTAGTSAYGMTVSTFFNDCNYGSRWIPMNVPSSFSYSASNYFCSVFFVDAGLSPTLSYGDFATLLPSIGFYYAVAGTAPGASIRAGWIFWTSPNLLQVVGLSDPAQLLSCPVAQPVLQHNPAASYCGQWMTDDTISIPSATLAIPQNSDNGRLLNNLRRVGGQPNTGVGPATSQLQGYVDWIGIYGISQDYDNGSPVTYTNWAPGSPQPAWYPVVVADDLLWYTVSSTNSFPFCCQSSGAGSVEQQAVGRIQIFFNQASSSSLVVPTVVMNFNMPFTVFENVPLLEASTETYYGVSVSIDDADCATAGMRIITSGITAAVNTTNRVLICSVTILPSTPGMNFTAGMIANMLRQIQIVAVSESVRPPLYQNGTAFRVLYYYLDVPTSAVVGPPLGYPGEGPHLYQCFAESLLWRDAADACVSWGNNFGYLATPQSPNEQALISQLRGEAATSADAWIGMNTYFTPAGGATNDCMLNGDVLSYTNWALNQPTLFDAAVVMSSEDGSWLQVYNDRYVNYSYCCERTSRPSVGDSGIVTVVPFGAPPEGPPIVHRSYPTVKGTLFQPFKSLDATLIATESMVTVGWGVTVAVELDACQHPGTSITWSFISGTPAGYVMCPTTDILSPAQLQFCPAGAGPLLQEWCIITIVREDQAMQGIAEWVSLMMDLVLTQNYLVLPSQSFTVAWSLWHDLRYPFEMLRASDGIAAWCSNTQVSFNDAAAGCVSWFEDAYLASILYRLDSEFVMAARQISENFPSVVTGDAWIGLIDDSPQFVNGDTVTYTNWSAGQPDLTGPTVMLANGAWSNVVEYAAGSATLAGFCCKRLAAGGTLPAVAGGIVVVSPRTNTPTHDTFSATETLTETLTTTRYTTQIILRTPTPTATRISTSTQTWTLSDTARLSLSRMTATFTTTASLRLTLTKTPTPSLVPGQENALVTLSLENGGYIYADAIAGAVQSVEQRTVYVRIQNSYFRAGESGAQLAQYVTLTPQLQTFYGFSALESTLITDNSFTANATHLMITFNQSSTYDITNNEIIYLNIATGITYMTPSQQPSVFPTLQIVVVHGDSATPFAYFFINVANVLALFGSPSALKDQQVIAIVGAMKCARGSQRVVFRAAERIITPLYFGNYIWSEWIGAFLPSFAFVWLHTALLIFLLRNMRKIKGKKIIRRASRIFYPSLSLFVVQILHIGVVFYSIQLVQEASGVLGWTAMALWSLLYAIAVTLLVLFWSIIDRWLSFVRYTPAEFSVVPWYLSAVIPFGYWAPEKVQRMTRWAIGDFRVKTYASLEYFVGWFVATAAAYQPSALSSCVTQYAIMGSFFVIYIGVIAFLRPFRSVWANVAACISNAGLAGIMISATEIVYDPLGASQSAMDGVRWFMTALVALRGAIGIAVFYLEWRLVEAKRRELLRETARIKRRGAIQGIIDDGSDSSPYKVLIDATTQKAAPTYADSSVNTAVTETKSNPLINASGPLLPPSHLVDNDDHTVLASILHTSGNSTIYHPVADGEIERRQRLQRVLLDDTHPSTGLVDRGGAKLMPSWL